MKTFIAPICLLALVACSVENGGKILQPTPSGTVQVRLVGGSSAVLTSGPKHPIAVHNGFSLNATEAWYTNYFTAKVVSYTASIAGPCFRSPDQPNNTVLTFTVQKQPPLKGGGNNACYPGNGDVEGIQVTDVFGHSTTQYFENVKNP